MSGSAVASDADGQEVLLAVAGRTSAGESRTGFVGEQGSIQAALCAEDAWWVKLIFLGVRLKSELQCYQLHALSFACLIVIAGHCRDCGTQGAVPAYISCLFCSLGCCGYRSLN